MPFDLESSKTAGELMALLADKVGLADHGPAGIGAPALPDDAADQARLLRFINEGYKMFLRADPDWTFLEAPVTLQLSPDGTGPFNVNGEPDRYRLPHPIRSRPRGNWTYKDHSATVVSVIEVAPRLVETARQATPSVGCPHYAACRRIPVGDSVEAAGTAWEVIFYPKPSGAFIVEATFRVFPYDLVDLQERHIAGGEHDDAIIAAAHYLWELEDETEPGALALAKSRWDEAREMSKALDRRNRPRFHGRLRDPSIHQTNPSRRGRGLVLQVGDKPVP